MWLYNQQTGLLSHGGIAIAHCYSGLGAAKNDPACEQLSCRGPIPRGRWVIDLDWSNGAHGPVTYRLSPAEGTDTHGRSGFLIHADSVHAPGTASQGCIVVVEGVTGKSSREIRLSIKESGDSELEVV